MTYRTSPTRRRRTKPEMELIRSDLWGIVARDRPMTVRQVFYQAVTRGLVDKTEPEYKTTVCRLLAEMRLSGELPFDWIADETRWMRKPSSYSSLDEMLLDAAQFYRRDLWESQDVYVEIWLEKEALAGVLFQVTSEWDVPLMVTRGYPSLSFVHGAAEAIAGVGKPTTIYYFGDHDPSGVDIPRNVEQRLREFAPDAEISFERVAVTPEQISEWDLPTRPTKRTDTRSRRFVGDSVEVDAIVPDVLRQLVRNRIEQHVDDHRLEVLQAAEESEREILFELAGAAS